MEEDYGWLADPRLAPRVPVSQLRLLTLSPSSFSILFSQDFPLPPAPRPRPLKARGESRQRKGSAKIPTP